MALRAKLETLKDEIDLSIFANIRDPDVIEHIQRVGVAFYQKGEVVPESVAAA